MTRRNRTLRATAAEFVLFAVSVGAFQGSRLLVSVVATRFLSPSDFGLWGLLLTVLGYSNFANFGVLNGANREIPIALGSGDEPRAIRVEQTALGATLLFATGATALGFFSALAIGEIAFVLAAVLFTQQVYLFYQVSLRSRLEFNRASGQQLLLSLLFLTVGLGALSAGVFGLLAAQLGAYAVGSMLVLLLWRRALRPVLDRAATIELVKTGLPIMLAGLAFSALTTTDRWIVAAFLGPDQLGYYSLGALVASGLILVSVVVGQQFYPRMAMRFGESRSPSPLLHLALQQSGIALGMTAPLVLIISAVAQFAIPSMAPDYGPAVILIQVLSAAMLPLAAATGYTNLLVSVGRAAEYLALLLAAVSLQFVLGLAAALTGAGTVGVAVAATAAYTAFAAAAIWLAHRRVRALA